VRILYYSCHAILEYDEVSLLRDLGHTVFPLGTYFGGHRAQAYRPPLPWSEKDQVLLDQFKGLGCAFEYDGEINLKPDFVRLFDLTIVMHDPAFIRSHWPVLSLAPVVWRTIGQGSGRVERKLARLRQKGMRIVRYSPIEQKYKRYIGSDGLVRFYKNAEEYSGWTGHEKRVLTFSNHFRQRYPIEYAAFVEATRGLDVAVGGSGNEGLPNSIGLVDHDRQKELLRSCRAYVYASGAVIPYTLNFIEAWIAGIPMVVMAPNSAQGRAPYAEYHRLITHGVDGFVARSPTEANAFLRALVEDNMLAARIGEAGKRTASNLFGVDQARRGWTEALDRVATPYKPKVSERLKFFLRLR
jgi:hypothetical protein